MMKVNRLILISFAIFSLPSAAFSTTLLRTTYFGTPQLDDFYSVVQAPNGTIYAVGVTESSDVPGVSGGAQPVYGGGPSDMIIVHMSANLKRLFQATYLGGSGTDIGHDIKISPFNGDIYVLGSTTSSDFPMTQSGAQNHYAGDGDAVVAVLSPNLRRLLAATYLGGSGNDTPDELHRGSGRAMSLYLPAQRRAVYVGGPTTSTDFPGVSGGAQSVYGGGSYDGFVAELSPSLRRLEQATYIGGSSEDIVSEISGSSSALYVAGFTKSANFPVRHAEQNQRDGPSDAFISAMSFNLKKMPVSTFLGGSSTDFAKAIVVDEPANAVYVAGWTSSTDFPAVAGGAQPTLGGSQDAFVSILPLNLQQVEISTYDGGSGNDEARSSLTVSPVDGSVYLAGVTQSTDFPHMAGGIQAQYLGGSSESFVTMFTPDLTQVVQSTYFEGSTNHTGIHGVFVDPDTLNVYVCSGSGAPDLPNTAGAYDPTFNGGRDGVIAVFPSTLTPP